MAMLSTYRVLLLVLLFSKTEAFVHPRPAVVNEWSARIGLWLTEHILNNASGIEYLTERYKSENIPLVPVHGEQIVTEIADNWENLLGKKMTALEHLVRHLEEECLVYKYDPDITPDDVEYHPAKNVDLTLANSTKFGQPVNTTASVVHIPTDIFTGDPRILNGIKWTSKLDEVYISNYKEDPSLIWQYFGSAEGYMRTYPAHNWSLGPLMIDEYDVRRRTWYIQAAASPKDMMILIDVSGSVHGLVLELIKASAVSLIDTLGENDFVNIASFNERARFVSCFETFVQANERNKNVMKDKIRLLVDNGIASFDIGFTFAFEQFKKFKETSAFQEENQGANCSQVIMLLTDGGEQRAEEVFRNYNLPIETRVFTYVVGPQVTSSGGVKYMACENEGYFSRIPAVGAIRLNTLNYVRVLSRPMALERARVYQWSNIYLDAMGLGMMTTVTLPVYNRTTPENQQLLGVTGTDVTIADMEELIPEYKLGPASYAFGINTNGYILIHPRLKGQEEKARETDQEGLKLGYLIEPPNVDLLEVELPTAEKEQLRKAMIDGKNGTIVTETLHRNTNELLFERYVFLINMTYWYRFINSTSFSMAIALPSFNLWSMDLNNRSFNEFQTKDQLHSDDCYILIAPWMFCPDQKHNATAEVVDSFISDFLENHNNSDCDHEMLTRLLIDLYATEDLEQNYWVAKFPGQGNDSLASLIELGVESLIVGTMGGLTRIYPKTVALELSDVELDNLRDPWKQDYYERALYINDYVISVPHNSGRNRDDNYTTVVSASKAVRLEKDVMPAVIKVTLQQEFFNMGWKEQTDKCFGEDCYRTCSNENHHLNCYLLDNGGFVVASNQEEHVSYIGSFFGLIEGDILNEMVNTSVYDKVESFDFQASCLKTEEKQATAAGARSLHIPSLPEALTLNWWATKASWSYIQYNLYNILFSSWSTTVLAQEEESAKKEENISCIKLEKQYYYGPMSQEYSDQLVCSNNCSRDWSVSRVPGTNLLLVIIEPDCGSCPNIIVKQEPEKVDGPDPCVAATQPRYRMRPGFCYNNHPQADYSDCGKGSSISASIFTVLTHLTCAFLIVRLF